MNANISPNSLQIGSAGQDGVPSFVQSGQIDWVAFANSTWLSSTATLQRFASAGVQPVTFGAGIALASQFQLGQIGNQRMDDALKSIAGFWGYEKLLWFGFGVRSFVRVMSDTQLGINCIALCSCLAEVHSEDASAWILEELWKTLDYPSQYSPSHAQFVTLIKACAGVITKTAFSSVVDCVLGHAIESKKLLPMVSDPSDVAKALQGIFQISTGKFARIEIKGGLSCAFLASLAHWLFNFTIYVEDHLGVVIYQTASYDAAQVFVTYSDPTVLAKAMVSSTSFVLHEFEVLFYRKQAISHTLLTFRTPWDGCLNRVFGSGFNVLIQSLPQITGKFLGSAARIHRALAEGEADVASFSRRAYANFPEASYGRGFVSSTISLFPELGRSTVLCETMQIAAEDSFDNALRSVELTMHNLSTACQCNRCTKHAPDKLVSCLLAMTISIRAMVSTISCTARDPELLPTIRGMIRVYNDHATRIAASKSLDNPSASLLSTALGLRIEDVHHIDNDRLDHFDLLTSPMVIFGGIVLPDHNSQETSNEVIPICTAEVRGGLCYYLDCLRSMSSQAETARIIHIIPGHIQIGDKQYKSIHDCSVFDTNRIWTNTQFDIVDYDLAVTAMTNRHDNIVAKPVAMETTDEHGLDVYYETSIQGEPYYRLRPGWMTYKVLKQTGILNCRKIQCNSELATPCNLVNQGWHAKASIYEAATTKSGLDYGCLVWPILTDLARCIAIQQNDTPCSTVCLRRAECLPCCTATIMRGRANGTEAHLKGYHIM